jgi:hypothetical protein
VSAPACTQTAQAEDLCKQRDKKRLEFMCEFFLFYFLFTSSHAISKINYMMELQIMGLYMNLASSGT